LNDEDNNIAVSDIRKLLRANGLLGPKKPPSSFLNRGTLKALS
jgi:hypothetical protein